MHSPHSIIHKYQKLTTFRFVLIVIVLFIAFCGWSSIDLGIEGWSSKPAFFIGSVIFFLVVINKNDIKSGTMQSTAIWTLVAASLSYIPAIIDWNASSASFLYNYIATYYGLAFYFLLSIWKVAPKDIIRILVFFCLIWVIIEIGQQFTYPTYWFLGRNNGNGSIENRMGLWRFYIWGIDFVMLLASYYIGRLVSKNKLHRKDIIFTIAFSIGILCYCSRKHIICLIIAYIYAVLEAKSKHKWTIRIAFILLFIVLFFSFYYDFSMMNAEQSEGQGKGEEWVRFLSGKFYLTKFSDSPLYPFFGTGWGSLTLYFKINTIESNFGLFRSDIGILGYYSSVGAVGVSAIIMYIYKFISNWKYIDLGYRLFFIMKIFMIIFDFWMMWAIGIIAFGTFLYLLDQNIKKNKIISNIRKNEHRNTHIL